jgi:hypothetical protein
MGKILRYLKMLFPRFGIYTNTYYNINGIIWFGRLIGICNKSKHCHVFGIGEFVNTRQYHLRSDSKPQFTKKT